MKKQDNQPISTLEEKKQELKSLLSKVEIVLREIKKDDPVFTRLHYKLIKYLFIIDY